MADASAVKPPFWARALDYVLGRNTLIGIAEIMLLLISGYATWHGMRDFIVGVSTSSAKPGGGFSLSDDLLVIMVVVALTFLMWLMLHLRGEAAAALPAGVVSAVCLPGAVVDRFRLRLLVEPDLRRRGNANRPDRPAGRRT
jgi:hypothetical protein